MDQYDCTWVPNFPFTIPPSFSHFFPLFPPKPTCSDGALYAPPSLSIWKSQFFDKVNYITANVDEGGGYVGISQGAAVSGIPESRVVQDFFLSSKTKLWIIAALFFLLANQTKPMQLVRRNWSRRTTPVCSGQTWPNQTKLSEFRLSRISWRIPKRRLPGSLFSIATVQKPGWRLFSEVKLSQGGVRTASKPTTNISVPPHFLSIILATNKFAESWHFSSFFGEIFLRYSVVW